MLLLQKSSMTWSAEQKVLAQNIFYRSQSAYVFLRDGLNLNLPHVSSLHRWSPVKNMQPGFINTAHNEFLKKFTEMDKKSQICAIVFDEIAIRRDLTYNSAVDIIDGLEDTGFIRSNCIGKQVCVFMLRGPFSNWKCILNYFVSKTNITGEDLKKVLLENLKIAEKLNLNVKAVICDQGPNNRKCLGKLGVTKETPFFIFNKR